MRSAWSGKSSAMPCRASPRATSSRNCCSHSSPAPTTSADHEHQRRMAPVPGPERVAHAHDVPLTGCVAPRQPVVLGHDRQLVGRALGEAQRGGVPERPARAVGGARRRPLEAARLHPCPHAQPVLGAHEPVRRRPLGARASTLQHAHTDDDDGHPDDRGDSPRRQRVDDRVGITGADRPPPEVTAEHDGHDRRADGEEAPAALGQALAASVGDDRPREASPPAPGEPQAGDLDARAGDAGQRPGRELVDVVEDLLLVALEGVALAPAPVGQHDDLVLGVLDPQPPARDEVEQRRHGRRRRDDEPVGQQAGDGGGLRTELGRRRRGDEPGRAGPERRPQLQRHRRQQEQDRPPQQPGVGSREEPEQPDHPSRRRWSRTASSWHERRRERTLDVTARRVGARSRTAAAGRDAGAVEGELDRLAQRPLQAELGARAPS